MHDPRLSSDLLDYLHSKQDEFVYFLRELTLAESPSSDPDSQPPLRGLIADALNDLNFCTLSLPGQTTGGSLFARPRDRERGRSLQLLLGHYDTVWPRGTLKDMPFEVDGNVIRGPGVYDMKAGVTQIVFALRALRTLQVIPTVTPIVFLNSDEEIGSRESGHSVRRLSRIAERAFVMEPSLGPAGKLKTARKAVGRYTVTVRGKAAHAGLNPEEGASAILELSHVIQQLFGLNDADRGITVNVGTIDGGLRPNVVAPESKAVIDVRVPTQADAEHIDQAIRALKPETANVTLEVEGSVGRPALERTPRNRALWTLAQDLGALLGLELEQGMAGGGSDGSTASQYTATLDGLGAVGDGAHAHHEQLYLDETLERTALLAMLITAPSMFEITEES